MSLVLAAILLLLNLDVEDQAAYLNGVLQCVVHPHELCEVKNIPPGTYTFSVQVPTYTRGQGKSPSAYPITFPSTGRGDWISTYCWYAGNIVSDDCRKWVDDRPYHTPPRGTMRTTVSYSHT